MTSKQFVTMLGILLIILFLINQLTKINVFSPLLNKKEYNSFKHLKKGVVSQNYNIKYISNPYYAEITYDRAFNFFFIRDTHFRKIDAKGNEVMAIIDTESVSHPKRTPFVFTIDGVYDFSKKIIKKELFKEIHNDIDSLVLRQEVWQKQFETFYEIAETVVYGALNQDLVRYPIYFKIDNEWILLYSTGENIDDDYDFGITYSGYPAKFDKLIYLKDVENDHYANALSKNDLFMSNKQLIEFDFKYPSDFKINKLFFKKKSQFDHIAYTSIPISWFGTAYYELKINGEPINFKEMASKNLLSFSIEPYLNWYVLPEEYSNNTDVSFIEFRFPQVNRKPGNGLFIISKNK
jgi:hypothetical protein